MATNYNQYAYAIDPFVHLPVDQVLSMDEVIDEDALLRSEFYLQYLKPENIGQMLGFDFHAAPQVVASASPRTAIACHFRVCRPGDARRFSVRDRALLGMLIPHLKQAVHWHSQNDVLVSERELYAVTVDRILMGMVIFDESGAILKITQPAREILDEGDGIRLVDGALRLAYEQDNRRLQRLIAASLALTKRRKPAIAEAMAVTRPSGRTRLGLVVRAIPHNPWAEGKHRPTVAVMIRDPERKAEGSQEILRALYELTPAESALALKLANGMTLDEASDILDIRKNTARAHLRSIFSKTGVTRQTMLVRLILGNLSMG
jgi:DNA-binding CsgD family transcriptional regulator